MLPSLEKMRWSIGISVVACMLLLPSLSWAEECNACRAFEGYCQGDDGSVGVDSECPALPPSSNWKSESPTTNRIACSYEVDSSIIYTHVGGVTDWFHEEVKK